MEEVKRVRSYEFVEKVQQMVDENLPRLFVPIANELKHSANTIKLGILEELRCQSYQMQTGQAPKGAQHDLVLP